MDEIKKSLDERYDVGVELLGCMKQALAVYTRREKLDVCGRPHLEINIPRCSKEHLTYIVKELTAYTEELHKVRCELPRLLEKGGASVKPVGERIKILETAQTKHRAAVVRITGEIKVLRSKCKHEWPEGQTVECRLCGALALREEPSCAT
jgi:hypothetical protein